MAAPCKRGYEVGVLPKRAAPLSSRKRHRADSYVPHQPSPTEMAPPPVPVDPSFEPYNTSPAPNFGLDHLVLTSPGPQQRPYYPKELSLAASYYQDGSQASLMRPNQLDLVPSLNSHPDPWDPQRVSGRAAPPQIMNQNYVGARDQVQQSSPFSYYGTRTTKSDIDSNAERQIHDSGYYTQTHGTGSIFSGDLASNPECPSLTGGMTEVELHQDQYGLTKSMEHPIDCTSGYPDDQANEYPLELVCSSCNVELKNRSEFNKHKLRHQKPFKCDVDGCRRATEGFTTQNDLDRHKKSLHNVMIGKSFMCAVPHCAKKTKIWPRADNFRQHCQRLHKDWDLNKLMDRSWDLGSKRTCNSEAIFGLIEPFPRSGHFPSFDPSHSQLVTLQELSKASSDEKPMNAYDQAKGLLCQEGGDQGPTRNDAIHEHEQNSPVTVNTRDFSHDELVVDEQDGSLMVTSDTNLGSASNVSWKSGKQDMTRTAQSPCDDPSVSCKALQNKGNSTSRNPKIDKQGLASMVVNIADRLGSNTYESKESLHLAVQASVLSLLESKDCGKGCYINMQYKDNALDAENKFQCTYCSKKKKTQCDLNKHTKRHTRPYGCTYSKCPRRFGSKNDWKRHENTMHWPTEAWKCAESRGDTARFPDFAVIKIQNKAKNECGQVFYRREQFHNHLDEFHAVKDSEYVRLQCKTRRVGQNGQKGFWCGFCQTVVALKKRGPDAWDERFTHIDEHHFKHGERVESWFPMDKELPKGILDEEKQDSEGGSSGRSGRSKGTDEEPSGSDVEENETGQARVGLDTRGSITATQSRSASQSRQGVDISSRKWFCCCCRHGPLSRDLDEFCCMEGCAHRRCGMCKAGGA